MGIAYSGWSLEQALALRWQERQGLKPSSSGYNLQGRSAGACYSELRKIKDGTSPRATLITEFIAVHGEWEPPQGVYPALIAAPLADAGLNTLQALALETATSGKNLFLTGGAGTGKSWGLTQVIDALVIKYGAEAVAATASTGTAALNIGGETIHSFAGWWLSSSPTPSAAAINRWKCLKCLVIDEISMVDASSLDDLEAAACIALGIARGTAFVGHIQLVLVGDFAQLPPVGGRYAFESTTWQAAQPVVVDLVEPMRQVTDPLFFTTLARMRKGTVDTVAKALLGPCLVSAHNPVAAYNGVIPTKLYCTNSLTDVENAAELAKLEQPSVTYDLKNERPRNLPEGQEGHARLEALRAEMAQAVAPHLELKIGAQVMLMRNWKSHAKANGSRGVVVGFEPSDVPFTTIDKGVEAVMATESDWNELPIVKFMDGEILTIPRVKFAVGNAELGGLEAEQIPLRLAWALTIHRAQGASLDAAVIDLTGSFAAGQVYTALSRMRDRKGLWLVVPVAGAQCDQRVREFYGW